MRHCPMPGRRLGPWTREENMKTRIAVVALILWLLAVFGGEGINWLCGKPRRHPAKRTDVNPVAPMEARGGAAEKQDARESILDAACGIVSEQDAASMTLGAVAERAGVARDRLARIFPTREALLQALVLRSVQCITAEEKRRRAQLPAGPARGLKAHILSMVGTGQDPATDRVKAELLAAAAHDPKLLAPVRSEDQKFRAEVAASGLGQERATVIALAADGLRLRELLQASALSPTQREAVIAEMLRMADEDQAAPCAPSETGKQE